MWKIQANKIKTWFQTTHNKDIYQWRTHKHKSMSNLKQEITKYTPLTWITQQGKTNVARTKKVKYKVKHLDTI